MELNTIGPIELHYSSVDRVLTIHRAIITPLSPNATVETSSTREEPMMNELEKWSKDYSPSLFFQQMEVWVLQQM